MNDIQLLNSYNHIFKQRTCKKKKSLKHSNTEFNPMHLYKTENSMIHTYLTFTVTSLRVYKITISDKDVKQNNNQSQQHILINLQLKNKMLPSWALEFFFKFTNSLFCNSVVK